MLMNDRMKTCIERKYVLTFCNSFLKIDLNCVNRFKNRFKIMLKSEFHLPKKLCIICFIESPLKMTKNAFYFILKALFVLEIFKFLS